MSRSIKVVIIIFVVLLIDQASKIWIKTNMEMGEEISIIGNWAVLHFVENNGMAFGLSIGGDYGKLALSLFRILAVAFLGYYIKELIKSKVSFGLLFSFALILAGAIGNIIDSAFYGVIFSDSPYHGGVATMFPEGGGYAGFLYGKVVDMLYFPMFEGHFPSWFPFWAGERYLFFRPVFNVADMSITTGVISMILFHRSFFSSESPTKIDGDQSESLGTVANEENKEDGLAENVDAKLEESGSKDVVVESGDDPQT